MPIHYALMILSFFYIFSFVLQIFFLIMHILSYYRPNAVRSTVLIFISRILFIFIPNCICSERTLADELRSLKLQKPVFLEPY